MECNIGHTERNIRVGVGVFLLAVSGLTFLPEWGTGVALVVGIVALFTGIGRFCPLWKMLGIHTCSDKPTEHH